MVVREEVGVIEKFREEDRRRSRGYFVPRLGEEVGVIVGGNVRAIVREEVRT